MVAAGYPADRAARNRWILERRGPKTVLDPWRAYAAFWEAEVGADGMPVPTATVLLTNRECPWRCLMCDLWRNTLDERVPRGAIPRQIRDALAAMPADKPEPRQIKLYNAGSFLDPQAIPPEDYDEIARAVAGFERVVVECHPALVRKPVVGLRDLLHDRGVGRLEVAMGLETVHQTALERLNKGFTIEDFRRAADFLARHDIALRVFLLVPPPFLAEGEGVEWACRSLDEAFACAAEVCCLIPTRGGNGAMEALNEAGDFAPPSLRSLEAAMEYGLAVKPPGRRVFADLWDVERFYGCACSPLRAARLAAMNTAQRALEQVDCTACRA